MKTEQQRTHLEKLAESIARRKSPLGDTMDTQCWGAVTIERAARAGTSVDDYFGISEAVLEKMINRNRDLPRGKRNGVMSRETLALAK